MSNLFSKLNPRQLIVHFIASWLFIYAVHTLASLYDYSFVFLTKPPFLSPMLIQQRLDRDLLIVTEAGIMGLIVAYIVSWQISVKQKWFWLNSVVILVVAFVLATFDLLGWNALRKIVFAPGYIFGVDTQVYLIINSVILLAVGSLLFFNKKIIAFIDKGVKHEKKAPAARAAKAMKPVKK